MNRNKLVLLVLVIFYFIIGIESCAKKQGPITVFDWVLGKWKLAKTAMDNGKGGLGTFAPVSKEQNWVWNFKNNSTATEFDNYNNSPNLTINYTWKIVGTDSLWIGSIGAGHDTTTFYIVNINSSEMILTWMNTINGINTVNGYDFTRQ